MSLSHKCFLVFFLTLMLSVGASFVAFGQGKRSAFMYKDEHGIERSVLRKVLNQFSLTMMTGYGRTFYNHDLSEFALLQKGDNLYIIDNAAVSDPGPNTGYSHWMTDPQKAEGLYKGPNDALIHSDTTELAFKVRGASFPLLLMLHYNINRFRVGVGVAVEYHKIAKFSPKFDENFLINYEGESINSLQTRLFGTIGAKVYDYWDYSFVADAQFGKHNRGGAFNKTYIDQGMYFNIGVAIEKNLSEYFRVVLRPSYEFSSYTINLPETTQSIKNKAPALYLQAGISLTYPEIPRCPIKSCHTQMKHVHYGKEFRGQPLPKKQVPGYGENHPELDMYKGRRKGKRNVQ